MKVLVNTRIGDDAESFLREKGFDLFDYDPRIGKRPVDALKDLLSYCDGYIAGTETIDAALLAEAANLKVIVRLGSGLDNVDLEVCKRKGIKVAYTPDAPVVAVAELTVGLMLSIARRIPEADRALHDGIWWVPEGITPGVLLQGKTVGIAGVGRIGSAVARLLFGFRVKLIGHDENPNQHLAAITGLTFVNKDELLARSDFLLLHLPLTPETEGWLGADDIRKMKRSAFLINTSRGKLIDEKALYMALGRDMIRGAALDVFANEPYEGGPLTELPNVVLTRHIGSHTAATREQMCRQAVEACWIILSDIVLSNSRKNTWRIAT